jgi:trimeric autotransporter adhesin
MGLGQGSIIVQQKKEPPVTPVPPFPTNSADNGLSVDPVSFKIVLGQDVGAVGNPAILLSNREIPVNLFSISLNAHGAQLGNILQVKNGAGNIRARVTSLADFSNTDGQVLSEKFGAGAIVSSNGCVAVGSGATCTQTASIALGSAASTTGQSAIAIGAAASVTANNGIAIGQAAISTGGIAIGNACTAATGVVNIGGAVTAGTGGTAVGAAAVVTGSGGVAIGSASTAGAACVAIGGGQATFNPCISILGNCSAANQFVCGVSFGAITEIYFGSGVVSVAPNDATYHATGGSGNNLVGANIIIAGGKSTGNATPGGIKFQVSTPTASGTTLQTLANWGSINYKRVIFGDIDTVGNASILDIDDTAQTFTMTSGGGAGIGGIKTNAPSATGAGLWLLGKNVVAASALDATQYLEAMVDGVLYKLALIV